MVEPVTLDSGAKSRDGNRLVPAVLAVSLVAIHLVLSWSYGLLLPWGGDEWYTYDGRTLMAVPNTVLIELARAILGEVTPDNFMWYRFTGVVWTSLAIAGLFLLGWRDRRNVFLVPAAVFLVFSPFVFYQDQYFRYYGYYLSASFGVFLLITSLDADYRRYRYLFWGLLLVSPFIYLFLGLQIGCYIAYKEWTCLRRGGRIAVVIAGLVATVVIITFWGWLIRTGMEVAFSGMSSMADVKSLRGFSPGLVIKPFYFVFESFWGYHVEPTENLVVMALVGWIFVFLALRFLFIAAGDPGRGILIGVCFLLPLALIYLALEPFTPPGATQLESKHALFGVPWLLLIGLGSNERRIRRVGLLTVFSILAISLYYTFRRPAPAWPLLVDEASTVVESGGRVILDGRSGRTFRFYAADRLDLGSIFSIGDREAIDSIDPDLGADLMVVHNDWKAYQLLNLKQNWNSGSSSASKVDAVAGLESFLRAGGYRGDWGLVRFPLHAFIYGQGDESSSPIPSVLPIAYRDLEFPRSIGDRRFIGAARLSEGRSVVIEWSTEGQNQLFWFLKGGATLEPGTPIGTLDLLSDSIPIEVGPRPESAFEAHHCRSLDESTVFDQWRKRPLVSQASKYPGSFFPAEGRIYGRTIGSGDAVTVRVSHPGVELMILVPEPSTRL